MKLPLEENGIIKLTCRNEVFIKLALALAVLFVVGLVYQFGRLLYIKLFKPENIRQPKDSLLKISITTLGAIWMLRYAVGYFMNISELESGKTALTTFEEIWNSLVHALQSFSMDEDYTEYILSGKDMIRSVFGEASCLVWWYGVIAAILNALAPIAGGAIVFEIISRFFPKVKVFIFSSCIFKCRTKYYFSELNDASVAILKRMRQTSTKMFSKPIVIFTDAYRDDENEKSSELYEIALSHGAILVNDDLSHVYKSCQGERVFFLVDEDEEKNLEALTKLAEGKDKEALKNATVYLFFKSDAYIQVERRVVESIGFAKEELPRIKPIQKYKHLVQEMLVKTPLYEPLIEKQKSSNGKELDLNITILGMGIIGKEMLLASYWFSQILNCKTTINVFSQEDEAVFWSKLDNVNPEIKLTTRNSQVDADMNPHADDAEKKMMANNASARCDLLRIKPKKTEDKSTEPEAPVYCTIVYKQCDIESSQFITMINDKDDKTVSKADYIFVSLGKDERNISVANALLRHIGKKQLEEAKATGKENAHKVVLNYVVYNSEVAKTLNKKKRHNIVSDTPDIYMQAVGSIDELYSSRVIFALDHEKVAIEMAKKHEERADNNTEKKPDSKEDKNKLLIEDEVIYSKAKDKEAKRRVDYDGNYNYWSSVARTMHQKYKAFSAGLAQASVFGNNGESYDEYNKAQNTMLRNYRDMALCINQNAPNEETKKLFCKLAWLEHRRWNAYLRTIGYRSTDAYELYCEHSKDKKGDDLVPSYKNHELKLHPCLVECDDVGVKTELGKSKIDGELVIKCENSNAELDLLDLLTEDLAKKKFGIACKALNSYDFKIYDFPCDDFPDKDVIIDERNKNKTGDKPTANV